MPKLVPAPNHQATPIASLHNQLTPISEHTSLTKQHATPTPSTVISASVMEHMRQVSDAVDNLYSRKPKSLKKKKRLYSKEKIQDIEDDTSPPDLSKEVPTSTTIQDHVPFTARPHPLITSEDITNSNRNNNGNHCPSTTLSHGGNTHPNSSFGNSADASKKPFSRGSSRAGSALGSNTRGAEHLGAEPEEDYEYFSELPDNVNRRHYYMSAAMTVSLLVIFSMHTRGSLVC